MWEEFSRTKGRRASSGQEGFSSYPVWAPLGGQKSLEHCEWVWPETSWTPVASLRLSVGAASRRLGPGVRSGTEAQGSTSVLLSLEILTGGQVGWLGNQVRGLESHRSC